MDAAKLAEQIELNEWMFSCMADAYPHEAHDSDPERFWEYFHAKCPHKTREDMERLLKETEQ